MFFHHHTTRKYTVSLLKLFNDIEVPRYDEETGALLSVVNVPINFSTKERAVQLITEEYTTNSNNNNILPVMSLTLNSIDKAYNRDTNKYSKKVFYDEKNKPVNYQINSASYNFSYTISIMARTMTDLTTIVEQILPMFRPTYNIRIQELDYLEETTSIPLDFEGISFDFPDEQGIEDDIRIVSAEISLTLRGNLYLPIKDARVIKEVYANIISNSKIESTIEEKAAENAFDNGSTLPKTN